MRSLWKWIRGHLWIRRVQKRDPYVPQRDITIVVAGNYRQFAQWCLEQDTHPSSRKVLYIPVNGFHRLMGVRGIKEVVYTGTWRYRPDMDHLAAELDHALSKDVATFGDGANSREDPY